MKNDTRNLFKLLKITRLLAVRRDLDVLLDIIIDEAAKVVNADRGTLFLLNKTKDELLSFIAQEIEINEIRLPLGVGIAGRVAKTKKPMNIASAYNNPFFYRGIDKLTGYQTKTILCVPLLNYSREVIGVLEVLNKKKGRFTAPDEKLLSAFADHAAIALENARILEENTRFSKSLMRTLIAAMEAKDPATAGHSERVTHYALKLGRALNLSGDELRKLEIAAFLHDVGKIGIADKILLKKGRVTEREFETIKKHTLFTKKILEEANFPEPDRDIPEIAHLHHERIDGKGYPCGLAAGEIPLLSRILTVADYYDAMTSGDRKYRNPLSVNQALLEMKKESGALFDSRLLKTFIGKKLFTLERRSFLRIDLHLSMEYQVITPGRIPDGNKTGPVTKDVSGGGLLFFSGEFIPVDTFLLLTLFFPDMKFKTLGKVMRAERNEARAGYNIGIQFENLSKRAKLKLQSYLVNLNRKQPPR